MAGSFDDIVRLQQRAKDSNVCWICLEANDAAKKEGKPLPEIHTLISLGISNKKEVIKACPRCDGPVVELASRG